MISDELKELLTERLTNRIEKLNAEILKTISDSIDEIGKLTPSNAFRLSNILKYGGDYNKIVKEIQRVTNLNVKEIEKIFDEVALKDYMSSKEYYLLKNKGFIPYEQNIALKQQVNALKEISQNRYLNFSNTGVLGFTVRNQEGKVIFKDISTLYQDVIDEAVLNVYQGKESFDKMYRRIVKELGKSGLKTVDYESGYTRRLDSAVRMNIQGAIRDLENELQLTIGQQTNCDGIEVSVHENPAPDHEPIQGHQFRIEEYKNMQNSLPFKDVDGTEYEAISRHIGEYNCYHNIFSITVGINKPIYSKKELKDIIKRNNKEIEIDGKKYNKYECTQLQRRLETEIRKQKDIQIMCRDKPELKELLYESQKNINNLKNKYIEISNKANLKTKLERMSVSNYRKIKIKE